MKTMLTLLISSEIRIDNRNRLINNANKSDDIILFIKRFQKDCNHEFIAKNS